jgi:hypothetical protein
MSNANQSRNVTARNDEHRTRLSTETKSAFKTTEFIVYVLVVIAIVVTAAVVGDGDGKGRDLFDAYQAMQLIVAVTIAYLVSRGLAKAGSRDRYDA